MGDMHFSTFEIFLFIAISVITVQIIAYGDPYRDDIHDRHSHTSIRRKRGWIKGTADVLKDFGKTLSKGTTTRLSTWRRVFRAKRMLLSDAGLRGTKENVDRYVKDGGYERARRDFKLLDPHDVISLGAIGGKQQNMKSLQGKVGDNILMMVYGDYMMPVISMWRVGENGGRIGTQISVFYR